MNISETQENGGTKLHKNTFQSLEDFLTLSNSDNRSRCNALKKIHDLILSSSDSFLLESELNLENLVTILLSLLSNNSEKCRELAASTLTSVFTNVLIVESSLSPLFGILSKKLCKTDDREPSEEVRLIEITLINGIIQRYDKDMLQYLSDISSILSCCIIDECPDVKRKACECVTQLSIFQEKYFHMVASTFLKSLLLSVSHQHLKTRALCITALGAIFDYLNSEEFAEAVSHLSQRLFDRSPVVRLSASKVIGKMLLCLRDRYSYFPRLIPLMLSLLYDEVEEIRNETKILWTKTGDQYLKENEKDYKDLMDFPLPTPEDYPLKAEYRPTLGCRILIQRHLYAILPPLVRDLGDWVPETRAKSCTVLYALVLHAEEKITMQVAAAAEGLIAAARDDAENVVEQSVKCIELLGYFVEPNLLMDTLLSLTYKCPSAVHLCVLAAALSGMKHPLPSACETAVCKFLANPAVSRLRKPDEQANLLLCVKGLLSLNNTIDPRDSYEIFCILFSIKGLSTNAVISTKIKELISTLESSCEKDLLRKHSSSFLHSLAESNEVWSSESPETAIFISLVESEYLLDADMPTVLNVSLNNLHPSKDAKVRGKILPFLSKLFQKWSFPPECNQIVNELLQSGLLPNMLWSAGKTAAALRTLAAATFYDILSKSQKKEEMLRKISDDLLPLLSTLSEDESSATRLLACKTLDCVLPSMVSILDDPLKVHRVCHDILPCMDDASDDVRCMTTRILRTYIESFPNSYDWKTYRPYLKSMFETVLVHMDDTNQVIRTTVFDLLTAVAFTAPDILLEEVESKRYAMSASNLCEDLIQHVKSLKL